MVESQCNKSYDKSVISLFNLHTQELRLKEIRFPAHYHIGQYWPLILYLKLLFVLRFPKSRQILRWKTSIANKVLCYRGRRGETQFWINIKMHNLLYWLSAWRTGATSDTEEYRVCTQAACLTGAWWDGKGHHGDRPHRAPVPGVGSLERTRTVLLYDPPAH